MIKAGCSTIFPILDKHIYKQINFCNSCLFPDWSSIMPYFAVVAKTFNFCFNHWTVILACNNSSSFKYHPVFTPDLNISHENWNDSTFYNLILTTLSGSSMEGAGEAVLSLLSTFWYLTSSSLNSLNSLTSLSCKA